jgi:hypothetical protein
MRKLLNLLGLLRRDKWLRRNWLTLWSVFYHLAHLAWYVIDILDSLLRLIPKPPDDDDDDPSI